MNKEYFIELIKSNSLEIILKEEIIIYIFNNIKVTLYKIYKFYIFNLYVYVKKEERKSYLKEQLYILKELLYE